MAAVSTSTSSGEDVRLTAGNAALRATAARLRWAWPVIAVPVALAAVLGALSGRSVLDAVAGGAIVIGFFVAVLGPAVLVELWYRNCTVTLNDTELVIHRVRRRVIPRAEIGRIAVGASTPGDLPDNAQVWFAGADGRRLARLPGAWWPTDGLAQLITALGVPAAPITREDRKLLVPWWIRRPVLATAALSVAVVVAVGGVIVGLSVSASSQRRAATRAALAQWRRYAATHLSASDVPRLLSSNARSTSVDGGVIWLYTQLAAGATHAPAELPVAVFDRASRGVCGFRPDIGRRLRVSLELDWGPPDGSANGREVTMACGGDRAALDGWLAYLVRHPLGRTVPSVVTNYGPPADDPGELDVSLMMRSAATAPLARALAVVCGYRAPAGTTRRVSASLVDLARGPSISGGSCAHRRGLVRQWRHHARGAT